MNYDEALSILNNFNENYPNLIFDKDIFKVSFQENEKSQFTLNISINKSADVKNLSDSYNIPTTFLFKDEKGEEREFNILIQPENEIVAHSVEMGTSARHINLPGYGTYGWGFILNGAPVALSNWHVFCPNGNNTPLGSRVQLDNQEIAALSFFEPVSDSGVNQWDMALATFDKIEDMKPAFRPCQNGNIRPYPWVIQSDKPVFGIQVYKVGATSPICREGVFNGIANIRVKYSNNVVRFFTQQLQFTKMTDPGDSGSIIVNATSNKVLGLNFAGNDIETFANPIFIYDNITYVGTKFISEDFEVGVYETKKDSNLKSTLLESSLDGTFPTETGVPPSLGGITGKYALVRIENNRGKTPDGLEIYIHGIVGSYGTAWIKLGYHIDTIVFGHVYGAGWIHAMNPQFMYLNQ